MRIRIITIASLLLVVFSSQVIADFRMIIASDPQPRRVMGLDKPAPVPGDNMDLQISKEMIEATTKNMLNESDVFGIMINGDLSESGSAAEVDSYIWNVKNLITDSDTLYFPGLGNHDIEKPIKKNNKDVVEYWDKHMRDTIIAGWGSDVEWVSSDELHYAFQKDGYLIVQLNVSPYYTRTIDDYIYAAADTFMQSMDDIARARSLDMVLNFHVYNWTQDGLGWDNTARTNFNNFLQTSNVVAIFIGHTHDYLGRYAGDGIVRSNRHGQQIEFIYSGAMYLGSYLIVDFATNNMTVRPVVRAHNNYSTHAFDDDPLIPFTITFGQGGNSQPVMSRPTDKCYQSYANPTKLEVADNGYNHLPYFQCDVNNDGAYDVTRFVGSFANPAISIGLQDTTTTNGITSGNGTFTNFSATSNEGIDVGYYRTKNIPNPWMEDVNGDGWLDYVRYVGDFASPWRAVILAVPPNGFDNANQLMRYEDASKCLQSKASNSNLPTADKGYSNMPYFLCDINGDGAIDFARYVGSSSSPRLSVGLQNTVVNNNGTRTGNGSYTNYSFSSTDGIDRGYYRIAGISNPWFEDVDKDGDMDYVRYVGSLSAPWVGVLLNTGNAFDSGNQYRRYADVFVP